jgi:hypothetical protein
VEHIPVKELEMVEVEVERRLGAVAEANIPNSPECLIR